MNYKYCGDSTLTVWFSTSFKLVYCTIYIYPLGAETIVTVSRPFRVIQHSFIDR